MKKSIFAASTLLLALSIFQACKKDPPVIKNTPSKTVKLGNSLAIWAKHAPATQRFSFDAANGAYIVGAKGIKIYIPQKALLDANNNVVTGTVDLELREYMSKGDMLLSGVTTVSGADILESGGMFYLMARKNGSELKMKNNMGGYMIIPQSGNSTDPMQFWKGELTNDSLNKVNWVIQDTVPMNRFLDTSNGKMSYFRIFNAFQFGYNNIDCKVFKNFITKFRIKMPAGCNDTNSTAMVLFKNYNAVACCSWIPSEQLIGSAYSLPLGETAQVLAYKRTGPGEDDYEYVLQEFTFTDNTLVMLGSMTKIKFDQLAGVIKAL